MKRLNRDGSKENLDVKMARTFEYPITSSDAVKAQEIIIQASDNNPFWIHLETENDSEIFTSRYCAFIDEEGQLLDEYEIHVRMAIYMFKLLDSHQKCIVSQQKCHQRSCWVEGPADTENKVFEIRRTVITDRPGGWLDNDRWKLTTRWRKRHSYTTDELSKRQISVQAVQARMDNLRL